jgi:hypothetical protein
LTISLLILKRKGIEMRHYLILALCFGLCIACGNKEARIEKTMENGTEVVLNHLEPYRIPEELSSLRLREVFAIDTEDDSMAAKGITDIYLFDVDSGGKIYLMRPPSGKGDLVYVFSKDGELEYSFGSFGQGPYELEYPDGLTAASGNEIWIFESPKKRIHIYDKEGIGIYEKTPDFDFDTIRPLMNGGLLIKRLIIDDPQAKYFPLSVSLFDDMFQKIRELDRFDKRPNRPMVTSFQEKTVSGIEYHIFSRVQGDRIYTGNSGRGYEILVFDTNGNPIRKIRKDYTPVPVSREYRESYLKKYEEFMPDYARKIYFPDNWFPFHSFFLDGEGRIFVMTYERAEKSGEYVYDVFNRDGAFILRTSMNILHGGYGRLDARAAGGRLYCLQEKDSGYKRLAVYEMIWE